jgi:hypothetical protein
VKGNEIHNTYLKVTIDEFVQILGVLLGITNITVGGIVREQ